jgi:hypothetical protein
MALYRDGFDTVDPVDVVSNTTYTTSNTTVRAASMNVTAPSSPIILIGGMHSSTSISFSSYTSPLVEDVDAYGGGAREGFFFASFVQSGSGASGDLDATSTASGADIKHAFAVALNPPSTPPPVLVFGRRRR